MNVRIWSLFSVGNAAWISRSISRVISGCRVSWRRYFDQRISFVLGIDDRHLHGGRADIDPDDDVLCSGAGHRCGCSLYEPTV